MKRQRPDISKKNPYYLPKHRFYELKHFCLQYNDWKKDVNSISLFGDKPDAMVDHDKQSDPVHKAVLKREWYLERIKLVERIAREADPVLSHYILIGVTSDRSYENLRMVYDIPASRYQYYNSYRRFFYILSQYR